MVRRRQIVLGEGVDGRPVDFETPDENPVDTGSAVDRCRPPTVERTPRRGEALLGGVPGVGESDAGEDAVDGRAGGAVEVARDDHRSPEAGDEVDVELGAFAPGPLGAVVEVVVDDIEVPSGRQVLEVDPGEHPDSAAAPAARADRPWPARDPQVVVFDRGEAAL